MWCLFFGTRFLALTALLLFGQPLSADQSNTECPINLAANAISERFSVARVTDGDTLVLSDERRVRIIGLNTLELRADNPQDQQWARVASQQLSEAIADRPVMIIEEQDNVDRYGRTLAHVLDNAGNNLALHIIESGLGLAVAIGQNTRCAPQMFYSEIIARNALRGIWQSPGSWFIDAANLHGNERGFHVLQSSVAQVTGSSRAPNLILSNGLHVRLGRHWPTDISTLNPVPVPELLGRQVEVRGWLTSASGKVSLTLHHPANLRVLSN